MLNLYQTYIMSLARIFRLSICFLIFSFFICCHTSNIKNSAVIETITAKQLSEDVAFQKMNLIDVRTEAEFNAGAIPNAKHLDFYKKDVFQHSLEKLNKKEPVIVYCKSGGRSSKTAKLLEKLGFEKVYDLSTGYQSWKDLNP